ncbi:L-type lectin-domain containing receptor kinase IV.4 [Ananas comosus]|uniref:L-type lectin-domain containing receptor kinase IV.4 n=1 Tax=Ananas comosus TaxID=4615 RepID=A0A199W6E6_ANACO|nr:L-type lectin-domain containing receptor kinase IV.4 [Ananas comosus]
MQVPNLLKGVATGLLLYLHDEWEQVVGGLGGEYATEEAEMALKLGLTCSHPHPSARPSMQLAVQYLEGRVPLPELSPA